MFRGCFEVKVPSNNKTGSREHMHEAYRFMQNNILAANWKHKNVKLFFVDEFEAIWFVYILESLFNILWRNIRMWQSFFPHHFLTSSNSFRQREGGDLWRPFALYISYCFVNRIWRLTEKFFRERQIWWDHWQNNTAGSYKM